MIKFYEIKSPFKKLFNADIELLPSVTELFELELAYLEFLTLPEDSAKERTAYLKSINGKSSNHFLAYSNYSTAIDANRSSQTRNYFKNGQFSTGYATHSLFPYRGKFHPQLIKALINIVGLKKGDTLLDPMSGSGTANIEASLLGIDSFAIDVNPFCQFLIDAKYEALKLNLETLNLLEDKTDKLFNFFKKKNVFGYLEKIKDENKLRLYKIALLAFLDSFSYSKRVKKSTHKELFEKVLNRYTGTVKSVIENKYINIKDLGELKILTNSDATNIKLEDETIDCVITSPPYSFAIDYVENDKTQLEYLGHDLEELKNKTIGLKGKNIGEKLEFYFKDMDRFCAEVGRVLKPNRYFILIIGSNTNQTKGIRLEKNVIDSADKYNLKLVKSVSKPIKGMRNTMKDEFVLIFEKI